MTQMLKLLRSMGVVAERSASQPDAVTLDACHIGAPEAPYEQIGRASCRERVLASV